MNEEEKTQLATLLAATFNETDKVPLYASFVAQVPKDTLLELCNKVQSIPAEKIRTSRAQYFNSLVQQFLRANNRRT
jgi:hypothetical protein